MSDYRATRLHSTRLVKLGTPAPQIVQAPEVAGSVESDPTKKTDATGEIHEGHPAVSGPGHIPCRGVSFRSVGPDLPVCIGAKDPSPVRSIELPQVIE